MPDQILLSVDPLGRSYTKSFSAAHDPAQLLPLVDLISKSVALLVEEYRSVNQSVPSLDSTSPSPFDAPESNTPAMSRAVQIIEAACAQLCFTVASPGHVMINKAYAFEEAACLQVVTEGRIADHLVDVPHGLSVEALASKSGLNAGKLGRILRMLATKHCFIEVSPNVFANNRLSIKLLSTDPVSSFVGHLTGEGMKGASFLNDALMDQVSGSSMSPADAPFRHAYGAPIFDYYSQAPRRIAERFNKAMVGFGLVTGTGMLPQAFPWNILPKGTTVCDVGGGNGHATLGLAKSFPHLRIIVQDLEHVVVNGKPLWEKACPEAVNSKHVDFVPLDFFKGVPVSGCDFYYLRHVLHDWPQAESLKIMSNIRSAMKESSRLLIHEFVLQHAVRDMKCGPGFSQAPEPLLPNFGMGRVRLYEQDINMMCCVNSMERTLDEFVELGNYTGYRFVKIWDAGEASLVEFAIA
ncbi:S-adenosyl-L-methionine-dependent methyltransferase [Stereum hirsutum FP-91666 SS1]|uniref:S-adenosyl-L-methionine-dependent methyltransferase n=1 Tax=Stereum hirsutum (strain FP-91666) TaxID=721885 RepID=UPI000440A592|nr:S-adenosyl-L-methionine-dependent methyltransferase [Stereum hirsutum FP-91666 SS1]EIM90607.1 S-adenosyl-L-methionine-dependent methyltransferase [Stereum hirsutum FP-91666 SS1]